MFDTRVWSETELNLSNPVFNQTTVMHLDKQLSLIPRVEALVLNQTTSAFA